MEIYKILTDLHGLDAGGTMLMARESIDLDSQFKNEVQAIED